jgi:hypothetical protein
MTILRYRMHDVTARKRASPPVHLRDRLNGRPAPDKRNIGKFAAKSAGKMPGRGTQLALEGALRFSAHNGIDLRRPLPAAFPGGRGTQRRFGYVRGGDEPHCDSAAQ